MRFVVVIATALLLAFVLGIGGRWLAAAVSEPTCGRKECKCGCRDEWPKECRCASEVRP